MATKPTENGNKARFIYAEIDDLAADNQEILLDLLEKLFGLGREGEMQQVIKALKNNSALHRITTLLRAGKMQEAEDVIMGIKQGGR